MNTQLLVVAAIALVLGGAIGYALNTGAPEHTMSDGSSMEGMNHDMQAEMDGMMQALEWKTGNEFDRAFLTEMIMHHKGAVDMAEAALQSAKHEEIRSLATTIITAQEAEIEQMQSWQEAWYGR